MTKSEWYDHLSEHDEAEKRQRMAEKEWVDRIAKLAIHRDTVIVTKKMHPKAWDFIEQKFPSLVERISATKILKNDNTAFCRNIGIPEGAGGLYVKPSSTILIFYNRSFPDDIVIVHELLHLVSRMLCGEGSTIIEEDFAYGQSLPYVLSVKDREWVVEKYLMPYYYGYILKKHRLNHSDKSDARKAKMLAEEHCCRMIDASLGELPEEVPSVEVLDGLNFLL